MRRMNLHALITSMTVEEREALAKKVPTDPTYLWQLSKQWRGKKPSLGLMQKLVAADARLTLTELVEEFAGEGSRDRPEGEATTHGTAASNPHKRSAREAAQDVYRDKPTNRKER